MDSMATMARGRLMLLCLLDTPRSSPHHPPAVAAVGYAGLGYAGFGYHGLGYGLPHAIVKRDADPAVIAGRTTVLSAPTPLIHNPPVRPVVHAPLVHAPAVAAVGYAGLGYHGLGYGLPLAHGIVKRDAEADPAVKPVVEAPAEVSHEVTAHAVPVAVGYHGYGLHGYYGKREADAAVLAGHTKVLTPPTPLIHNAPVLPVVHHAPAVAAVGYAGLGYAGLGYHGLGYGLPHAIVKRDADPAVIAGRTTVLS